MKLLNEDFLKCIKPTYDHDEAIEFALCTWYPKDHPLHSNPHQPLGKLLGEWGELLDDYMKGEYKPCYEFKPVNELVDVWYYFRILCHQRDYKPMEFAIPRDWPFDYMIAPMMSELAIALISWHEKGNYSVFVLDCVYSTLIRTCEMYGTSLDELTTLSWEKLKPGSVRGDEWTKAWG